MKQILTLLMALGAVASVNAQSSHYPSDRNDSRDVILGQSNDRTYENNSRYNNSNSFTTYERDRQIERINREYDYRIRQAQKDRWSRPYEKSLQVRRLEEQRRNEIRQVWDCFKNNRDQYRDNNSRNDRKW